MFQFSIWSHRMIYPSAFIIILVILLIKNGWMEFDIKLFESYIEWDEMSKEWKIIEKEDY